MKDKDFRFRNGEVGAALAVRVIPRAVNNEIVEVLKDGTIKIRLADSGAKLNEVLVSFLADVLEVPADRVNIVAGESKRDKLVSVLNLDPVGVQKKIIANLT